MFYDPNLPLQYLQDRWAYSPDSHGPSPAEYEQLLRDLLARVAELETALHCALQFRMVRLRSPQVGDPAGVSWYSVRQELQRVVDK